MKVAINAILYHEKPRGVGVYLNNLIASLTKINEENEYYVFYGEWMGAYEFTKLNNSNVKLIPVKCPRNKILRNLYQILVFPFVVLRYKVDIVHIPDTSPVLFKTTKVVSTIHDLAEFVYPQKYSKVQAFCRKLIVRNQTIFSDKIISISNYSKKHIVEKFNIPDDKVSMIYNGVNLEKFYHESTQDSLEKFNIKPQKYFLYVGEIERTKNVPAIILAYSKISKLIDHKIVICGKSGNDMINVQDLITDDIKENIVFTGYVTDTELRELYSHSAAFVFPSLFEGFGLPILEALSCDTLVITSNRTSLPEVGGEAVLTFDPTKIEELADLMLQVSLNRNNFDYPQQRKKQVESFSWEKCAIETQRTYSSLM